MSKDENELSAQHCPNCGVVLPALVLVCPACNVTVSLFRAETENDPVTPQPKPTNSTPSDGPSPTLPEPEVKVEEETTPKEASRKYLSSLDLAAIRKIGAYVLLEEIAHGGMGIVYRAQQNDPDRIVALKVMITNEHASEHQLSRFLLKARAAMKLSHPNIVPIFDICNESGVYYFTMEFVTGQPLSKRIASRTLTPAQSVAIVESVAGAVHYAHTQNVLHRDLNPKNILIDEQGQPHITDFGLTGVAFSDSSLSVEGTIFGTPAYMSPEQTKGEELDPRSDVYALGVILYEMLSGKPPFHSASRTQLLTQIRTEDVPPLRTLVPTIDPALETIVSTCLQKDPQLRYCSAGKLASDLSRYRQGQPIEARPPSIFYHLRKKINKHGKLAASLALVMILSVGLYLENLRQTAKQTKINAKASKNIRLGVIENLQEKCWEVLFADDFKSNTLQTHWLYKGGKWSIKDQHLICDSTPSLNGMALLDKHLRGDLKIQFEATTKYDNSQNEIGFTVFSSDKKPGVDGYFVSLQSAGLRIDRNNSTIWKTDSLQLEVDKTYTFRFEREGSHIRLFVGNDEKPIADFVDWKTPSALENGRFGFCTWNGYLEITNVKIQQTALSKQPNPLDVADFQRGHGHYIEAIDYLQAIIPQCSDPVSLERVLTLRAECFEQLADRPRTLAVYKDLKDHYPTENNTFRVAYWSLLAGELRDTVVAELAIAYPESLHWKEIALLLVDTVMENNVSAQMTPDLEKGIRLTLEVALTCAARIPEPMKSEARALMARTLVQASCMPNVAAPILCQVALEFDPQLWSAWHAWGNALRRQDLDGEAIEKFQKILEHDPKDGQAWRGWAASLSCIGRDQESLDKFQKATEYDPKGSDTWKDWGQALFNLSRYQEAAEKFQKATECNPQNSQAWIHLAMTLDELGRYDEVLAACAKSIELRPNLPTNKVLRGLSLIRLGKTQEGEIEIQKALDIANTQAASKSFVLYYQGRALIHQNKKNEALTAYQQAAKEFTPLWLKNKIAKKLKEVEP